MKTTPHSFFLFTVIVIVNVIFGGSGYATEPAVNDASKIQRYELLLGKKDKVCQHILNLFNSSVIKVANGPDVDTDSVFMSINWKRYGLPEDDAFDYGAEYAKFDINNDGHDELVIRWRHGGRKLIDVDSLFVFQKDFTLGSVQRLAGLETRSVGSVAVREAYELQLLSPLPRQAWMESGKQYFPGLTSYTLIRPFGFDGKYYLLLSESPDVKLDPELLVVARYKTGHVVSADSSKMSDICYLSRPLSGASIKR